MKSALKVALFSLLSAALLWPDAPPSAPNLISPASFAVLTNTNYVTLAWSASTDDVMVSNYTLMCTTNGMPYLSNALPTNTLSTNLFLPSPGVYPVVWSVFARDNSNQTTSSGSRTFYMTNASDVTPPTAAVPLTPTNGAFLTNALAQFDWQPATDNVAVTKYTFSLLTNGFLWRAISNITGTNISTNVSGAFSNTLMKWTVRAYDAANNSTASATNNFSWIYNLPVDNPPSAPGLAAPANNASFTNTNGLTFNWTPSTDDIALSNYTLVTRTNGGAWASNAYATNVLSGYLSFTFGSALNVQWFVLARDSGDHVTASTATNNVFLTNTAADLTPPSAPLLVTPLNSTSLSSTNAAFFWMASSDNVAVASYQLTLLTDGALWRTYSNLATTNVTVSNVGGFSNTNMVWYVHAYDAANNLSVSTTNRLAWVIAGAVDLPPSAPGLATPANNAWLTNTNGLSFNWTPSTDDIALSNYVLVTRTNGGAWTSNTYATNTFSGYLSFTLGNVLNIQWFVLARDSGNQVASSTATNTVFLTNTAADASPPSAPLLVSPAPAAALSSTNATFLWMASTDNFGVSSYTLTLLTNGGLWQQWSGLGATNQAVTVAAGFSNTALAWFVRAFDAAGNSTASVSNAFSWIVPAAAAPATNAGKIQLLAPSANAVVASNIDRVAFSWAPGAGSAFDRYQLLVYTYTPSYRMLVSNELSASSASVDLSAATNGYTSNLIRLYWTVNGIDASGRIIGASSAALSLVPPPQPGRGDIRPLVQDPVGQQILASQSNSAAVLEYMATTSNTVIPPIYNGEEVPLKYKVDTRTGAPLTARIIRVYDRRGRLIFEKAAPRGSFASWDKKDRQNRPVPAGMYVLEIVYDDGSSEKAMTVVPK